MLHYDEFVENRSRELSWEYNTTNIHDYIDYELFCTQAYGAYVEAYWQSKLQERKCKKHDRVLHVLC